MWRARYLQETRSIWQYKPGLSICSDQSRKPLSCQEARGLPNLGQGPGACLNASTNESVDSEGPSHPESLYEQFRDLGPRPMPAKWNPAWPFRFLSEVRRRRQFMKLYGWAVPTPAAISAIVEFVKDGRLLEVGAGHGLWAYLLTAAGVSVTPTDDFSWAGNEQTPEARLPSGFRVPMGRFFPVGNLDALSAVKTYPGHEALLLCWPPYGRAMAIEALRAFEGDRLVYIGDPRASGDEGFHDELQREWTLRLTVDLPHWPGIRDSVFLYERRRWRKNEARIENPYIFMSIPEDDSGESRMLTRPLLPTSNLTPEPHS